MARQKLASMSLRFERPDWVRRVNAMADSVGGPIQGARRLIPIDADTLLEQATTSLGGGPFGDFGDPRWQERFRTLVAALDAADMHLVGRMLSKQELLRALRSRLLLGKVLDENPAIADETIEAPIIVTGPARSGTSILFELLWLDPSVRGPLAWEALHPVPLPDVDTDRRLEISECEQEMWADVQPEFAAIHELRSDLPVECVTLTTSCFTGPHWPMCVQMDGWMPDMDVMYDFHKRILQVLQHGAPKRRWLLKTPGHLATLGHVFATYPDAWVVQTHRDPARTMPSTVSTTAMVQWLRADHVDLEALSAGIVQVFGAALNGVVQQRAGGDLPDRFVDVHFQNLLKDPVATLRQAYEDMRRPFTDEHADRIRRYLADKPKGKFGKHRYTPEEWGFTAAELHEQLAPYIEHFGVALEE